jgi:hypothetical protein
MFRATTKLLFDELLSLTILHRSHCCNNLSLRRPLPFRPPLNVLHSNSLHFRPDFTSLNVFHIIKKLELRTHHNETLLPIRNTDRQQHRCGTRRLTPSGDTADWSMLTRLKYSSTVSTCTCMIIISHL